MYGPEGGCRFSHDVTLVWERGCQYGTECRCQHPQVGSGVEQDKYRMINGLDQGVMSLARAALASDNLMYLESSGPDFDDTDPLWDEITATFREDADDGACDLTKAVRARFTEAGKYRMVDEEMLDEWICVRGEELSQRLAKAPTEEWRRESLRYELSEAKGVWELEQLATPRKEHGTEAMKKMDDALRHMFDCFGLGSKVEVNASMIPELMAACATVDEHMGEIRNKIMSDATTRSWNWGKYTEEVKLPANMPSGLQEMLDLYRCVKRCKEFGQAWMDHIANIPGKGVGLVEMARRAAQCDEHILIHHVVSWAGTDLE